MSEAAIGLIGVIVGAALTGGFEYSLRRRTDFLDSRASARLVRDALFVALESLPARTQPELPTQYDFSFALEQWHEHRGTLARTLTNEEWNDLAAAAELLAGISGSRPGEVARPTEHARELGLSTEEIERGVLELLADRLIRATTSLERSAAGRRHARRVQRELAREGP